MSEPPRCIICGRSGSGVQFRIFVPKLPPFGTACVRCEDRLERQQKGWKP